MSAAQNFDFVSESDLPDPQLLPLIVRLESGTWEPRAPTMPGVVGGSWGNRNLTGVATFVELLDEGLILHCEGPQIEFKTDRESRPLEIVTERGRITSPLCVVKGSSSNSLTTRVFLWAPLFQWKAEEPGTAWVCPVHLPKSTFLAGNVDLTVRTTRPMGAMERINRAHLCLSGPHGNFYLIKPNDDDTGRHWLLTPSFAEAQTQKDVAERFSDELLVLQFSLGMFLDCSRFLEVNLNGEACGLLERGFEFRPSKQRLTPYPSSHDYESYSILERFRSLGEAERRPITVAMHRSLQATAAREVDEELFYAVQGLLYLSKHVPGIPETDQDTWKVFVGENEDTLFEKSGMEDRGLFLSKIMAVSDPSPLEELRSSLDALHLSPPNELLEFLGQMIGGLLRSLIYTEEVSRTERDIIYQNTQGLKALLVAMISQRMAYTGPLLARASAWRSSTAEPSPVPGFDLRVELKEGDNWFDVEAPFRFRTTDLTDSLVLFSKEIERKSGGEISALLYKEAGDSAPAEGDPDQLVLLAYLRSQPSVRSALFTFESHEDHLVTLDTTEPQELSNHAEVVAFVRDRLSSNNTAFSDLLVLAKALRLENERSRASGKHGN